MSDAGKIGDSPNSNKDELPAYTKGVPSATPPGATPPVSAEPMKKLKPQPQNDKNADNGDAEGSQDSYETIRDRKKGMTPKQMFQANPGATFQSYGEETESDEEVIEEAPVVPTSDLVTVLEKMMDEESLAPAVLAPPAHPDFRWYVVHAYSGMEKAVERNIAERIARAGMQDKFGRIMVPTEEAAMIRRMEARVISERYLNSRYTSISPYFYANRLNLAA